MASIVGNETISGGIMANCIAWFERNGTAPQVGQDTTFDGTTLVVTVGGSNTSVNAFIYVTLKAGCSLTLSLAAGDSSKGWNIFACDNIFVPVGSGILDEGDSFVFTPTPAFEDKSYILWLITGGNVVPWTVTCSDTWLVNPLMVQWDDGGTRRNLEACPHLLLPILTEVNGAWYVSEAAAQAALDDEVSNCVGYAPDPSTYSTFTATEVAGVSLTLSGTTGASQPSFTAWGSVNAEVGETLNIAFTVAASGGTETGMAEIYSVEGILLETLTGATPLVSSALPYSARFIVKIVGQSDDPTASLSTASFEITSSGTITINPVEALYDIGMECPKRLACA